MTEVKKEWTIPEAIKNAYEKYNNKTLTKTNKLSSEFEIEKDYEIIDMIGRGAYGIVVAVKEKKSDKMLAIKKIQKAFDHKIFAKRTLRELKILRLLSHDNILRIDKIALPLSRTEFNDIYLFSPLVESDLYSIIKSPQKLEEDHIKFILYQVLRATKYYHSAKVLHRDLKPRNILISTKCDVTICDFGLARLILENQEAKEVDSMTDYVATRWYRAPELLLGNEKYDEKIDVWSIGCILAEMFLRKPFLMGSDWKNQLYLIVELLGKQNDNDLSFIENVKAKDFLLSLETYSEENIESIFKDVEMSLESKDLITKMLIFNPHKRISVNDALAHPFLSELYCPEDEPTTTPLNPLEFEFENLSLNKEQIKDLIYEEVLLYHYPEFKKKYDENLKKGISIARHVLENDNKDYVNYEDIDEERLQ